ncbi:hypothetical protein [Massilia sp. TWP1-3-3]|uniref:hypothetical protein n=1 Tax=Massilia sp. TWP1-3-3 TaxID=2804573 RepID=UPI003CFB23FB
MPEGVAGICWPHGGTVGCITVDSKLIYGQFPALHGDDAAVCCQLTPAGKYRNGAARAWCRAHQQYWGVKADLAALAATGVQRCAGQAAHMGYVLNPLVLDVRRHASVTITNTARGIEVAATGPALRAHVPALALACDPAALLFGSAAIVQINVTPPALTALREARESGQPTGCVECSRCGHPHLDLGQFAGSAHRRHYCGNCGHDATHSAQAMVSNPLLALFKIHGARLQFVDTNVHGNTVL